MEYLDYAEALAGCRAGIGAAPRRLLWWRRKKALRLPVPEWCDGRDPLHKNFAEQRSIFEQGEVVWARTVQANVSLFRENETGDCPAYFVYAERPGSDLDPTVLGPIARAIFKLKGTEPDHPGEATAARLITDEYARPRGVLVPDTIAGPHRVKMAVTQVHRGHLPNGYLAKNELPMLVRRGDVELALPLPSMFWEERYRRWWLSD